MEFEFNIDEFRLEGLFKEIDKLVGRIALKILERAKDNIIKMDAIAKGELYKSGQVRKIDDCEWEIVFDAPYSAIVEFGRSPSAKMPPIEPIKEWLMAKFGYNEKEARRRAWAVAKKIQKEGYLPRPFMRKAIEEVLGTSEILDVETLR